MKRVMKGITVLLLSAVICLGLAACGDTVGEIFVADIGVNPSPSPDVIVKTGTIATDSWGYTGSAPIQVTAPSKTEIVLNGHTLLLDASRAVVSGTINTSISFSSVKNTLSATSQASAPANFVSYLYISMGSVRSAIPALSVTVDVSPVAPGVNLTIYNYDVGTGKWISAKTAVVNSLGKITFPVSQLALWGIFQ